MLAGVREAVGAGLTVVVVETVSGQARTVAEVATASTAAALGVAAAAAVSHVGVRDGSIVAATVTERAMWAARAMARGPPLYPRGTS